MSGAADPALAAAIHGGNRTVMLAAFAAVPLIVELGLATRAIRANAELAAIRGDFVASITHELKTPIASIRAAGDTLAAGRVGSQDAQKEYAQLVVQESKRLSRLVDNLLAHARVTDIADVYSFEAVEVEALVRSAVSVFAQQLKQSRFVIRVDVPSQLPLIRADPSAMQLVLDNLLDNAIRYSGATKEISIRATVRGRSVAIEIEDKAIGVHRDDLDRVTQKFVRGRNANAPGSGLGLSIVRRVVQNHGGTFMIKPAAKEGTVVTVEVPSTVAGG